MMEPMLDCDAVMRQLWDYLDGELSAERVQAIEAHLKMCGRCSPQVEFERAFLKALESARAEVSNEGSLRDRVVAQLRMRGYTA